MKVYARDLADAETLEMVQDWCRQTGAPFDDRAAWFEALPDALVVGASVPVTGLPTHIVPVVYPWPEVDQ